MRHFAKAIQSALLAATVAFAGFSQDGQETRRYDPDAYEGLQLEILKTRNPTFPVSLKQEGISEGSATFTIFIENGKLQDYLPIEASDLAIVREIEKVLPQWIYKAPKIDGEDVALVTNITVRFESTGTLVYETSGAQTIPFLLKIAKGKDQYRVYSPSELDSIPEPIHVDKPEFHVELLEDRELINAVFEFYIDAEGNVRLPTLREADEHVDERLLVIAQESLIKWKFNPPTVNRRPVVARVAQPFRFLRGGGTASIDHR